jgi:ribokinase
MRAVTIGSATIDIIVLIDSDDVERITMHNATSSFLLLEQGKKVDAQTIFNHVGGGAVNAAVSLSRLGIQTEVLTKIGDDLNGKKVIEALETAKISANRILHTTQSGTGTSVMIAAHDRNVSIFTYRGANTLINAEDIKDTSFDGTDLVYLSNLSEGSRDNYPTLTTRASDAGAFVAVNPGILQISEKPGPLLDSLPQVDLMVMNWTEASSLIPYLQGLSSKETPKGIKNGPEKELKFGNLSMTLQSFANRLLDLGLSYIVVTDGAHGAYVGQKEGLYFCPVKKCEIAGTAGAGDAYASTLTGMLAQGENCELAMRAAALNSASVVSYIDTQTGLLDKEQLKSQLAKHKDALPVTIWN